MSIEIAVLLAIPAVGALWSGTLGITAVLTDRRNRRQSALTQSPRSGRHRLTQTGRHHLRPLPAHAG